MKLRADISFPTWICSAYFGLCDDLPTRGAPFQKCEPEIRLARAQTRMWELGPGYMGPYVNPETFFDPPSVSFTTLSVVIRDPFLHNLHVDKFRPLFLVRVTHSREFSEWSSYRLVGLLPFLRRMFLPFRRIVGQSFSIDQQYFL